ncbi:MAG TPA: ATPase domain-containing protein [Chloroflexota bacterium]|nr:ATPase domain-containing protein [Chloroflexota bacterium]
MHPETVPSGIPGLDPLLGGGRPARGIVFVLGAPGTGKTVLLQQLAFAAARAGQRALYFSGLSEPHDRLVEHLRPFAFYDERLVSHGVQFLSLASLLADRPHAASGAVLETIRATRSHLVLIDGFRGLRNLLGNDEAVLQFLYTLGAQVGLLGALLVVAIEGNPRAESLYPELTTGDVILGLYFERARIGHRRYLEVLKRRGAAPLPGLHSFTIDSSGLRCYPQFELTVPRVDASFDATRRAPFDLPQLDALLGGGLTQGTTTIVAGSPGIGKTMLSLQFVAAGLARGEPAVYLCFHESRAQLLAKAAVLGLDLAAAVAHGQVHLLTERPIVFDPDILAHDLRQAIERVGARRLVVDSLADLEAALGRDRLEAYLAALAALLRHEGVTALFTKDVPQVFGVNLDLAQVPLSYLAENVVVLRFVTFRGEVRRVLAVLEMRFSAHDRSFREFVLDQGRFQVLGRYESPLGSLDELSPQREREP